MTDNTGSSKPSLFKKLRINTRDLWVKLGEISKSLVFTLFSSSATTSEQKFEAISDVSATVPSSVAPSVEVLPQSVSETDPVPQPSPRVSSAPSSPPMENAEAVKASIAASMVDIAPFIEEFAASFNAMSVARAPSVLAGAPVISDSSIITIQVPLGDASLPDAAETIDKVQGEKDVDISFLDDDSPIPESGSVPSRLNQASVKKPPAMKPAIVATRRVTRSLSEQKLGLVSGPYRPLMKKARDPSPSDDDAEDVTADVSDISASDSEAFDSSKFLSAFHQRQYKLVVGRSLVSERKLVKTDVEGTEVVELLDDLRLEKSAYHALVFIATIVHEFYANLSKSIKDTSSEHAFSVFVRGFWISFSPTVINAYLGREHVVPPAPLFDLSEVAAEPTRGSRCVWPSGHSLLASDLSVKYSILHKIVVRNWIPSTHNSTVGKPLGLLLYKVGTRVEFNLGQLIYEHVVVHAKSARSQ
ncbi:hypothetical protein C2S53_019820 [Perilla frutescens var. hirtella]|uniref:Putative plant transposon protein domain-containing protein n=1 Tax=Perilla frutescens var. hirtella TaxID=608512 RepID=A0AAD4JKB7_PERFH|nr:hypothetical protein C2S53_019820 [Perilla frutescens var. hirtella]